MLLKVCLHELKAKIDAGFLIHAGKHSMNQEVSKRICMYGICVKGRHFKWASERHHE